MNYLASGNTELFFVDWAKEALDTDGRIDSLAELFYKWVESGNAAYHCVGNYAIYLQTVILTIIEWQKDPYTFFHDNGEGTVTGRHIPHILPEGGCEYWLDPEYFAHMVYARLGSHLDLIGDPDWPQDKIKARLQKIRQQKQQASHQLDNTVADLEPGRTALNAALELLDHPSQLYRTAPDEARKNLNKAIFNRLYLDATDHTPTTTQDNLTEPYASLVHATRTIHGGEHRAAEPRDSTTNHLGNLLTTALAGGCASKEAVVELRGIEPLTYSMRTSRATNCATAPCHARRRAALTLSAGHAPAARR